VTVASTELKAEQHLAAQSSNKTNTVTAAQAKAGSGGEGNGSPGSNRELVAEESTAGEVGGCGLGAVVAEATRRGAEEEEEKVASRFRFRFRLLAHEWERGPTCRRLRF
jgi:hypothetical protein